MKRMAIAIRAWQDCLLGVNAESSVDTMDTTTSSPQLPHKLGGTPALQVCWSEREEKLKLPNFSIYFVHT